MNAAHKALDQLKEGNRRFVAGKANQLNQTHKLIDNQKPFAIVLGCSDSRVPPEIVFDQGAGDLFVIRVAGNIVSPVELAGVEFAASKFGSRLVIVMGHSKCGAVQATVQAAQSEDKPEFSPGMQTIVDFIAGSVDTGISDDQSAIVDHAICENVKESVLRISKDSPVVQQLMAEDGMMVVGAKYSIETGEVEFFE